VTEKLEPERYRRTERRIAQLTLAVGAVASAGACWRFSPRVAVGVLLGSVLAWVNLRWLARALDALTKVSTAKAGSSEARLPLSTAFWLLARYVLIAAVVYVTFSVFKVPVLSMVVGLCALGAATISASLYEVLRPAG
jgi:hypothetical protein